MSHREPLEATPYDPANSSPAYPRLQGSIVACQQYGSDQACKALSATRDYILPARQGSDLRQGVRLPWYCPLKPHQADRAHLCVISSIPLPETRPSSKLRAVGHRPGGVRASMVATGQSTAARAYPTGQLQRLMRRARGAQRFQSPPSATEPLRSKAPAIARLPHDAPVQKPAETGKTHGGAPTETGRPPFGRSGSLSERQAWSGGPCPKQPMDPRLDEVPD